MKNYLKVDVANSRLVMDRTFAKNCAIAGSAEYNLLQSARKDYPNFTVEQRTIKRNANKECYRGLTYEYMKKYILAHDDEKGSIMAIFHELRGNVVSEDDELQAESLTYGEIKMWFLDTYPEIKNFHESRADRIKAIKEKQKLAAEAKAKAKKVA